MAVNKPKVDYEQYLRDKAEYDKGVSAAEQLSDYANVMRLNDASFVKTITHQHRTLQQNTMRLFLNCIYQWSETDCDGRNEETVNVCKLIRDKLDSHYDGKPLLPFI